MCEAGAYSILSTAVLGDLNGDGIVDAVDIFLCDKAINGHSTLTGAYFAAANVDETGTDLDAHDLSAIINRATGKAFFEPLTLKDESVMRIDKAQSFLREVDAAQSVSNIATQFKQNNVLIYKEGVLLNETDKIGTGCIIRLMNGTNIIDELTVVINGDINGDGVVDAIDVFLCNKAVNGSLTLTGAYYAAANVDESTQDIDISDYSMILSLAIG